MISRAVTMLVTLGTALTMLAGGSFHSVGSEHATVRDNAVGVQVASLHAGSQIRNPHTGQVITLSVYEHDSTVTIGNQQYLLRTFSSGIPTQAFTGLSSATSIGAPNSAVSPSSAITPYSGSSNDDCDGSVSWCVTLTMAYNHYTDHGDNCYSVVSPWYKSTWRRNDSSVSLKNTSMNLGIASGPQCGGFYYHHDNHSIAPIPGSSFPETPSWGTHAADTSVGYNQNVGAYQCVDIDTDLVHAGSTWHWTMYLGFGTTCMR